MTTDGVTGDLEAPVQAGPGPQAAPAPLHLTPQRLNQLRAAVLGVNDGIVSIAAIVVGVAGASVSAGAVFVAGIAGLVSGALSMAAGEYVSVGAQRDAEITLRRTHPEEAPRELTSAWHAAGASFAAFLVGGLVPLLVAIGAVALGSTAAVVPAVFASVLLALLVTGLLSARITGGSKRRLVLRNMTGGSIAMAVTYVVGALVGVAI